MEGLYRRSVAILSVENVSGAERLDVSGVVGGGVGVEVERVRRTVALRRAKAASVVVVVRDNIILPVVVFIKVLCVGIWVLLFCAEDRS